MNGILTRKNCFLVLCLSLWCALIHPAQAIGFATSNKYTITATGRSEVSVEAVRMAQFRKIISQRLYEAKPPAFWKISFFRTWIYKKMLRLLPDVMGKADKEAMWSLGLGIGGLLLFSPLGLGALYLGICALEDGTTKRTEASVGIVLGAITTLFTILLLILIASYTGWF